MTQYIEKEWTRYWPISKELMAQYKDGTNTDRNVYSALRWFQNGQLHRDGDRPAYIDPDGSLEWWQNGKPHRDGDKPAVIYANGDLTWYQNGLRHRTSGPAYIGANNKCEWWINNEDITLDVNLWLAGDELQGTPEQIVEFQLRFA